MYTTKVFGEIQSYFSLKSKRTSNQLILKVGQQPAKLRLGLEAANDPLETTVLVCGQASL